MLPLEFEPDYSKKILIITFTEKVTIEKPGLWLELKEAWCRELKLWHTPYKALLDMHRVTLTDDPKLTVQFRRLISFFEGLYLKKAVIYGIDALRHPEFAEIVPVFSTKDEALQALGVRSSQRQLSEDPIRRFRSSLIIENHLHDQLAELTFSEETLISSEQQVRVLRSKLTNNLMHWHGSWFLLIDLSLVKGFEPSTLEPLKAMLRFLRGFFLVEAATYGGKFDELTDLPITVFRSRHRAVKFLKEKQRPPKDSASKSESSCVNR